MQGKKERKANDYYEPCRLADKVVACRSSEAGRLAVYVAD